MFSIDDTTADLVKLLLFVWFPAAVPYGNMFLGVAQIHMSVCFIQVKTVMSWGFYLFVYF